MATLDSSSERASRYTKMLARRRNIITIGNNWVKWAKTAAIYPRRSTIVTRLIGTTKISLHWLTMPWSKNQVCPRCPITTKRWTCSLTNTIETQRVRYLKTGKCISLLQIIKFNWRVCIKRRIHTKIKNSGTWTQWRNKFSRRRHTTTITISQSCLTFMTAHMRTIQHQNCLIYPAVSWTSKSTLCAEFLKIQKTHQIWTSGRITTRITNFNKNSAKIKIFEDRFWSQSKINIRIHICRI